MSTAEHSFIVNRVELIAVVSPEDLREKGAAYSEIPLERWKEKKSSLNQRASRGVNGEWLRKRASAWCGQARRQQLSDSAINLARDTEKD